MVFCSEETRDEWFAGGIVFRSKSVEELNIFSNGLEPATLTLEALVVQYLHGSLTLSQAARAGKKLPFT
jgi:hypothetical protein